MSINKSQLKEYIIRPALDSIDMWSPNAEALLLGTAATESKLGHYVHQVSGPALGIYQMEPITYYDIYENYITYNSELMKKLLDIRGYFEFPEPISLIHDLKLATIMARLHYSRHPEPLPDSKDIEGLADYWKKYYNTEKGKGTVSKFIEDFNTFVAD